MFRNLEDSIVVNNFATKNNVKIIYTRQLHYDTMDPFSSFIVKNVSSMMNQGYSLEYSLKVKKGEWNGKSPYGYDLVNSHLQVNEIEANVIKLIFSMYACYNNGRSEDFFVEALPKVGIVGTTTNPMTIQNKTIKLRLGIGTAEQDYRAELYMESDGKCIFYMTLGEDIIPTLYSGGTNNHKLTFMTAMICVGLPSTTYSNSGSYFTNVRMQNSKLYAYGGNVYPFTTMGAHTYFTFICKPSTIDFSYGNNWETVDIVYDN